MKRALLLSLFLLACCLVKGQVISEGSLEALKGQHILNYETDFSNASIMYMTEEEFAKYEDDWNKDKPVVIMNFLEEINNTLKNRLVVTKTKNNRYYTLKWVVISISSKGDTLSEVHMIDTDGKVVAKISNIYAEGGSFGTKLNLIKQGSSNSGKKFSKFLNKKLK